MNDFEEFERDLRKALLRGRDPSFEPSGVLYRILGCTPAEGAGAVASQIIAAISDLEPSEDMPVSGRTGRSFGALYDRFVLGLTQAEIAERLYISMRHIQRVQVEGVHMLAQRLWVQRPLAHDVDLPETSYSDWDSQVELELTSLSDREPGATANVGETIDGVLKLVRVITARLGVQIALESVQSELAVSVHPSALRQTLITAITRLAERMSAGQMKLYAVQEGDRVKVTLTGSVSMGQGLDDNTLLKEIIAPPGLSVQVQRKGTHMYLQIGAPASGNRTVLVIEDNLDLVHFYERCTIGTTYHIVHVLPESDLLETVEEISPVVIVLDVMLPGSDGWQLLTQLHECATTRSIPVIVCTVVKENRLAIALGAALYLAKPVRPRDFVEALDQALHQV